jgi:hypothetical protein
MLGYKGSWIEHSDAIRIGLRDIRSLRGVDQVRRCESVGCLWFRRLMSNPRAPQLASLESVECLLVVDVDEVLTAAAVRLGDRAGAMARDPRLDAGVRTMGRLTTSSS